MSEKYREFTEDELKWIASLKRLMKKAPPRLFIFVGSSDFYVFSERVMTPEGSVDQYAPSISISASCEMDGGDY